MMTFLACLLAFLVGATAYLALFFALSRAMASRRACTKYPVFALSRADASRRAGTRHPVE